MILCCGEALIDMIPAPVETAVPRVEGAAAQMGFVPHCGGAVYNTAVALGRLGTGDAMQAGLFTGLSSDLFGQQLVAALDASGVDHSLSEVSAQPTTLAFVHLVGGHAEYHFFDENSAGGHLVARMLDPEVLPETVGARIRNVVPISPLSDLRPLLRTSMNEKFKMDAHAATAESSVEMQNRYDAKVTVWVGGAERPAFLDQAIWLVEAWDADHVIAFEKHHFNVIEPLADPESDLVAVITA